MSGTPVDNLKKLQARTHPSCEEIKPEQCRSNTSSVVERCNARLQSRSFQFEHLFITSVNITPLFSNTCTPTIPFANDNNNYYTIDIILIIINFALFQTTVKTLSTARLQLDQQETNETVTVSV